MRRRSNPARPYICRLSILIRFTCPSTAPELLRQSQSIQDRSVVGFEPSYKTMQLRQIISRDGRHPQVQSFPKASGEHLRERLDMSCSYFEVWAAGEDLPPPDLLVVGEVVFGVAASTR